MVNANPKQTILIVDDTPDNIKFLGEPLRADYRVKIATSGAKALEIAMSGNPPDLILLDIMMPGIDGYEVCRRLKSDKLTKNLPIIFITGKTGVEDETKGLEMGAVDYITKPFNIAIIKARVRTHLELKRQRDILENLSSRDGLTGIPNRRFFENTFDLEWKRSLRAGFSLSLIMMDIDYFKQFNDRYGHQAGDDCLKKVARELSRLAKRPADFVARYGGEEFVAVLPETELNGAVIIADMMRHQIESLAIKHADSQVSPFVTISQGLASAVPSKYNHPSGILEMADNALYNAKSSGRNCLKTS